MSLMEGRKPDNWDWFIDPVDIILSRLHVRNLSRARHDIKAFVDYMDEGWEQWGLMLGTFAMVTASGLDEEGRDQMRVFAMTLPQEPTGIDGELFDCLAAMEWIMADPNRAVDMEPFPMDNKYVYFTAVFCLLAGLFTTLDLPVGATPSLTIISVIQAAGAREATRPTLPS
jgi:hypothetical protein